MDNMDRIVEMCRMAVQDIIASVGGVQNLLSDDGRMELIQAMGNRLSQLGADVESILGTELANAYMAGVDDADAFMQTEGKDTTVVGMKKQIHLAGVQSIVADAMGDMSASFATAMAMGIADIDDILESVNADIAKGMILGNPSDVVARQVEQTFAKNGMTSFITKDNKRLPLDFYAQTVVRTKYRVANTTGAVNRYKESGVYHIKINEHHPTCVKCARYQGKVVALDPDHAQGFPIADLDIPLPPYHPNCQHTARPFMMDYHSQADINSEKRKWNQFDPDDDPRTDAQKDMYKNEQDIRRKARQEMKEYELMKATLTGDDLDKLPKTLGAYRRAKRKNDASWQSLQSAYKSNMLIVNGDGPGPGTPRKKTGTGSGAVGTATAPKKRTSRTTAPKPVDTVDNNVDNPDMSTMSTPVVDNYGLNIVPDEADRRSVARFDQAIDGIEHNDRRKASKHILASIPGSHATVKIAKIGANGHCGQIKIIDGKIDIGEFALINPDRRPEQYQYKTMYHEFFHANMQGLDYPPGGFDSYWTRWEETATETSALFMSKRAGIDISTITPSYANYLVETLPQLKQLDEFKDCVTLDDFGAKFMKYRFDPDHATANWGALDYEVSKLPTMNTDKYFKDHYLEHVKANRDRYVDMAFDSLQQDKTNASTLKQIIGRGLDQGIKNGIVNREVQMILPVAMNEVGVIKP